MALPSGSNQRWHPVHRAENRKRHQLGVAQQDHTLLHPRADDGAHPLLEAIALGDDALQQWRRKIQQVEGDARALQFVEHDVYRMP